MAEYAEDYVDQMIEYELVFDTGNNLPAFSYEGYLKNRLSFLRKGKWKTKDGRTVWLCEMSMTHLQSCYNMETMAEEFKEYFLAEIQNRTENDLELLKDL